jgi:hypothetical protein
MRAGWSRTLSAHGPQSLRACERSSATARIHVVTAKSSLEKTQLLAGLHVMQKRAMLLPTGLPVGICAPGPSRFEDAENMMMSVCPCSIGDLFFSISNSLRITLLPQCLATTVLRLYKAIN